MRTAWCAGVVLSLLLLLLAGCSALFPDEPEMRSALLDQLPADVPRARCAPAVLSVRRPEARPVYDTAQMAYTVKAHQVAFFAHHQWAETPGQMLHPLLVRTIEGTGCFSAVLTPPGAGATHALRTELLELVQDFTQQPPVLRLSLRIGLSVEGAMRPPVQRDIAVVEEMRQAGPLGGVDAANLAVARALAQAAAFVLQEMR